MLTESGTVFFPIWIQIFNVNDTLVGEHVQKTSLSNESTKLNPLTVQYVMDTPQWNAINNEWRH